jgi:hypothetical protein
MKLKDLHIGYRYEHWEVTGINSNKSITIKCDCGTIRKVEPRHFGSSKNCIKCDKKSKLSKKYIIDPKGSDVWNGEIIPRRYVERPFCQICPWRRKDCVFSLETEEVSSAPYCSKMELDRPIGFYELYRAQIANVNRKSLPEVNRSMKS